VNITIAELQRASGDNLVEANITKPAEEISHATATDQPATAKNAAKAGFHAPSLSGFNAPA
jgi:hypothetical protein